MATVTTTRCPAEQAKAGIDAMICLAASVRTERDPIVALLEVSPGLQVIVPQSQVTPAVREHLRYLTQRKLEELEREPTTLPTTRDTNQAN